MASDRENQMVRSPRIILGIEEIETLNRIVNAYLEFAELQAQNRRPMHMTDWISKLDDFLRLSDREILNHAGKVSHEDAKAQQELEAYRQHQSSLPESVDEHFDQTLNELKRIEDEAKRRKEGDDA